MSIKANRNENVNGKAGNTIIATAEKIIAKKIAKCYVTSSVIAMIEKYGHSRKSAFTVNFSPVCISDNMTAKMENIPSISTSNFLNDFCLMRQKCTSMICSKCFAKNTLTNYKGTAKNCEFNHNLFKNVLSLDELPRFSESVKICRFESFGDLYCENQIINYFNICKLNPHVNFALWTKNPKFIARAINNFGAEKPANIVIIYSSPVINAPVNEIVVKRVFPFIDKIFTVYDENYINENGIEINCGARDCFGCQACYNKNGVFVIREKLK